LCGRGLDHFEPQPRKLQPVAVLHCHEGIFRLSARAKIDGCAATVAQFEMAGHKIGVEMREKDMADLQSQFSGVSQILLNIALRIHDDSGLRSSPTRYDAWARQPR
jgi:hypothetical protein